MQRAGLGFAVPGGLGWVPVPALQPHDSEGGYESRAGMRVGQAVSLATQLFYAEPLIGGQRQGHMKLVRSPSSPIKDAFELGGC